MLVKHCFECHSAEAGAKGGLNLDSADGALLGGNSGAGIVPGNPGESLLISALRQESFEMPPSGPLPDEVIADFVRWIEMGASDPRAPDESVVARLKSPDVDSDVARKHWAFQPPQLQVPPAVQDESWPRTDADRFILAKLEEAGLGPAPPASRRQWLRRVTFDLVGLPPTPEEIDSFLNDESNEAYERIVDRLLASPQFGERWARHWLDVARFGESTGNEFNRPYPLAWPYRNWVIDAVNADKPYDQFLIEQLAGDQLPAESIAQRDALATATGFLAIGTKGLAEPNPEQYLLDVVDEQIDVVTRSMLGLTVACARCHDHKFDPVPTADYYALAGIFRSTQVFDSTTRGGRIAFDLASCKPLSAASVPSDELSARVAKAKELETRRDNVQVEINQAVAENSNRVIELREQKKTLEYELNEQLKLVALAASGTYVMAVADLPAPVDVAVRIRGEVAAVGAVAPRGMISVIRRPSSPPMPANASGRLEFARWVASPDNPLTARVALNRIWSKLFGRGLAATPDNFGIHGDPPSHPELLDFLALQFVKDDWSTKKLVRSLVLSSAYRQESNVVNAAAMRIDGENRLLWRMRRRRLDAEELRDAVLAISGQLELARPQGSIIIAALGMAEIQNADDTLQELVSRDHRRSIYLPTPRGYAPEMLQLFDQADSNLVVPVRSLTGGPSQSLYLMNSPFVLEQSRSAALRVASTSRNVGSRVDLLYELALARRADGPERNRIKQFVRNADAASGGADEMETWALITQAVFALPEFRYLD